MSLSAGRKKPGNPRQTMRKIPPICLIISLMRLLIRDLRLPKHHAGKTLGMENGEEYTVFRHITRHPAHHYGSGCVFVVRFRFARLSHKANKLASIIPMLIISGYPGFVSKIYAVNLKNGYWQGMYQWESLKRLAEYKNSLVFRIMNKRALPDTIESFVIRDNSIEEYIGDILL
jgi:hypothetical protein